MSGLNANKDDWQKTMEVNIQGSSNMVQACHPYLKKGKYFTVNYNNPH